LLHKAFALQIRQNLGCYIFTLLSLRTKPLRFCKNLLCPATLKATIVLPAFTRSCSTDGGLTQTLSKGEGFKRNVMKSGERPDKKRGPGCFACGRKDLFVLIFGYFGSSQSN